MRLNSIQNIKTIEASKYICEVNNKNKPRPMRSTDSFLRVFKNSSGNSFELLELFPTFSAQLFFFFIVLLSYRVLTPVYNIYWSMFDKIIRCFLLFFNTSRGHRQRAATRLDENDFLLIPDYGNDDHHTDSDVRVECVIVLYYYLCPMGKHWKFVLCQRTVTWYYFLFFFPPFVISIPIITLRDCDFRHRQQTFGRLKNVICYTTALETRYIRQLDPWNNVFR